jgi:hypothetical protein
MSALPIITALSVKEIVQREDAALSFGTLISVVTLLTLAVIGLIVALTFIADRLETQRANTISTGSTIVLIIGWIVSFAMLLLHTEIQRPAWQLATELQTAISAELSTKYRFQDVAIDSQTDEADTTAGIRSWMHTLHSDALEPARVLVRLEEGPTVPYELRLVGDDVKLYSLHGDTTVPDPQELRRLDETPQAANRYEK